MKLKDAKLWKTSRGNNTDPYGKAGHDFAEEWADLMEIEMAKGTPLEHIAEETSKMADKKAGGITGFMYGCAVQLLAACWIHGDQLRKWHNGEYGQPDAKGTVNPAIITIGVREPSTQQRSE